jgi:hypothetical protein
MNRNEEKLYTYLSINSPLQRIKRPMNFMSGLTSSGSATKLIGFVQKGSYAWRH